MRLTLKTRKAIAKTVDVIGASLALVAAVAPMVVFSPIMVYWAMGDNVYSAVVSETVTLPVFTWLMG